MPQSPDASSDKQIPLVVDLDGTLIKTDLLWEFLARLLRRNPLWLLRILFWWMRGRACLKKKMAARVKIDPAALPYNDAFLNWLREQKTAGRKIILATASDLQMAKPVADYIRIFDDVLASDGKTNLRSKNKLAALVSRFGERGFDYAGNSTADLAVWRGAREAIVVNAGNSLVHRAAQCAKVGATFIDGYCPFLIAKRFCNELLWQSGYLVAVIAGLLLAAAFPKINIAGFAWIAPALLVFAARNKPGGEAFRIGYIGGLVFWLASLYWLLLMPAPGFAELGWIALCIYLALYPAAWLSLVTRHASPVTRPWSSRLAWSLTGAAGWVALEMIRARLFSGFPWSFIGVSQFHMVPLIQIASVTGVYGVSFLVVWASLSLFSAGEMIFQKPASRYVWQAEIFLPLIAVVAVFVFGEMQLERGRLARESQAPDQAGGPPALLRVTLVQPSIPQTLIWDESASSNRFQQLLELSEQALNEPLTPALSPSGGEREKNQSASEESPSPRSTGEKVAEGRMRGTSTDLLVWPESAVPELDDATYVAITNLVRTRHVWLIFNADDVLPKINPATGDKYDVFNAAFLFSPRGEWDATYHKQKLVIFGEYIPLVQWLPFVKYLTPITGGFAAGNEPVQFDLGPTPGRIEVELNTNRAEAVLGAPNRIIASPLICFEDTFPSLARKATRGDTDFLVNLTNDGWFGDSAEQWQHMANAVFRAVENGVPLVRCCNNGITCWIDAQGRVREVFHDTNGSVYGPGAMTIDLPLQQHAQTFYNRHGDWFGWMCVGWAVIGFATKRLRRNS